jgi:hypothetical protein
MKYRVWALPLIAVASLFVLAGTACDDDDDDGDGGATPTASGGADEELTLYFNDLAAIQGELSEGIELIDEQSQAAFADPAAARQTLSATKTAGEAAMSDLQDLDVPSEAADAHASLETAGQAYLDAIDGLSNDLQNISGDAEYDAFLAEAQNPESEIQQARADLQTACGEMQTVADDNNVDVAALECPA